MYVYHMNSCAHPCLIIFTVQSGFYYDCYMGEHTVAEEDLKKIEDKAADFCKNKLAFQVGRILNLLSMWI